MSVVALHPEELIDREASGELTPVERERLELHLAHCSVCRVERSLRADFRKEDEPLDPDFDVRGLLSRALAPGSSPGAEVERRPRRLRMRKMRVLLLVAAVLCVAGASVAAGWKDIRRIRSVSQDAPVWQIPRDNPRAADERVAAAAPPPPVAIASPIPIVAPSAPERPALIKQTPAIAVSGAGASTLVSDAAALFARANASRRSGDHVEAVELYRTLAARFPRSAEAHEAQAALGRLLLDDGNASGALRCFDQYVSAGGPLEEDVRVDRAQALGRLHRSSEEADAWSSFLRTHPASVHAERARERLRELGAR